MGKRGAKEKEKSGGTARPYGRPAHNSSRMLALDGILALVLLALDQYVKVLIRSHMQLREHFDVIPGVLQIYYHENDGAAFGLLKGQTVFFIFIAIVVFLGIGYILYLVPPQRKYVLLNLSLVLVLSGAIGNTIDRVQKASVTDFIYFVLINFPIFNIADMYIVVATVVFMALMLFVYREEDLVFLNLGRVKGTRSPQTASAAESGSMDGAASDDDTASKGGRK